MRLRSRCGFTLVELLVAVLLIDVALLAMVAGSAVVVRRQSEVRARRAASQVAANRLQALSVGPCAATAGATTDARLTESWTATLVAGGRELVDSVRFTMPAGQGLIVLRTRVSCAL